MKEILRKSMKFSFSIAVITLVLAAIFSIVSTFTLSGVKWGIGMIIVLFIVLIGIFFDMIGIAAAAGDEVPFNAMAAERVKGAKHGILITRNADRVASFCNDVIGDISGIISGTASALVVIQLTISFGHKEESLFQYIISIVFTSVIAALTVGGKSFGKSIAIRYSTDIILRVGQFLYFLEEKLKLNVLKDTKKKKRKETR